MKWISVKEKMPEFEYAFALADEGEEDTDDTFGLSSTDVLMTDGQYIAIGGVDKYENGDIIWMPNDESSCDRNIITHWMPLPELPKE